MEKRRGEGKERGEEKGAVETEGRERIIQRVRTLYDRKTV